MLATSTSCERSLPIASNKTTGTRMKSMTGTERSADDREGGGGRHRARLGRSLLPCRRRRPAEAHVTKHLKAYPKRK